jgi:hypothetical protein
MPCRSPPHAPDDQTPQEPGQTHAQVGIFEQAGPNQARLLLPAPLLESDFDILWLTRSRAAAGRQPSARLKPICDAT